MKTENIITIVAAALAIAGAASCQRELPYETAGQLNPITFTADDCMGVSVTVTRSGVDPVESLDVFEVTATTGSSGSEVMEWANATFSKVSGTELYTGGKMWPSMEVAYHFYASNSTLSFGTSGCTVSGDGTEDIVCAYLPESEYNKQNSLAFNHIYARIGEVSIEAQTGYEISDVSISMECPVTGTYDIRTGAGKSDGTGWTPSSPEVRTLVSGANDQYVIPGEYVLKVSYKLTKDEWSESFDKTAKVCIVGGMINIIKGTAIGGNASEVTFDVTVAEWDSRTVNVDWDAQ